MHGNDVYSLFHGLLSLCDFVVVAIWQCVKMKRVYRLIDWLIDPYKGVYKDTVYMLNRTEKKYTWRESFN